MKKKQNVDELCAERIQILEKILQQICILDNLIQKNLLEVRNLYQKAYQLKQKIEEIQK